MKGRKAGARTFHSDVWPGLYFRPSRGGDEGGHEGDPESHTEDVVASAARSQVLRLWEFT